MRVIESVTFFKRMVNIGDDKTISLICVIFSQFAGTRRPTSKFFVNEIFELCFYFVAEQLFKKEMVNFCLWGLKTGEKAQKGTKEKKWVRLGMSDEHRVIFHALVCGSIWLTRQADVNRLHTLKLRRLS